MKCPACSTSVADDVAVCPTCDHILDASVFSSEPPSDDTPQARRPASARSTGAARSVLPKSGAGPGVKRAAGATRQAARPRGPSMPEAPGRRSHTPPEVRAPAEDWHVKPSDRVDRDQPASDYQSLDPDDWMTDVRHFVVGLSTPDKIAFWGSLGALLGCFLPWRETVDEGDLLGLVSLGAAVFAASIVSLVAIAIRVRRSMPRLHPLVPWLLQFGSACFSIVWCLALSKLWWDGTIARSPVGNFEMMTSKPTIGLFVSLALTIVALTGTLLGLREKA